MGVQLVCVAASWDRPGRIARCPGHRGEGRMRDRTWSAGLARNVKWSRAGGVVRASESSGRPCLATEDLGWRLVEAGRRVGRAPAGIWGCQRDEVGATSCRRG